MLWICNESQRDILQGGWVDNWQNTFNDLFNDSGHLYQFERSLLLGTK